MNRCLPLLFSVLLSVVAVYSAQGQLSVSGTTTTASCPGNGTITASASGGTSPYQYRLDSNAIMIRPFQTSTLFSSLRAGTYTVVVQDAAGAKDTSAPVMVTSSYVPMTGLSVTQTTYYAGSCAKDQVQVNHSGGTSPFSYALLNGASVAYGPQTSNIFPDVAAGSYTVRITDACGEIRTLPGVSVASVDYKWRATMKTTDNFLMDLVRNYPPAPFDSTKRPYDRSDPYLFTCDSLAFRLMPSTLYLPGGAPAPNTLYRRVYIRDMNTNIIIRDLTYRPADWAGGAPTIHLKTNTPYRLYFDDLCNDVDSIDRNYNYFTGANWFVGSSANRDGCNSYYVLLARPNNWNTLNRYSSPSDTFEITASSLPGDSMVGKKYILSSVDVSLNPYLENAPRFYGITPGNTYTIKVSNACTTYTMTQLVSAVPFSVSSGYSPAVCKEYTGAFAFTYNSLPLSGGYLKYTINSGPSSFTDQYGTAYTITYPIRDSFYVAGTSTSQTFAARNFPYGTYNITFTNQCGETTTTSPLMDSAHLLHFNAALAEKERCGTNNIRVAVTITDVSGNNTVTANSSWVREFWNGTAWVVQASTNFFNPYYVNFISTPGGVHHYDFSGTAGLYRFSYQSRDYYDVDTNIKNGPIPADCENLFRDTITIKGYQNPVILPRSAGFLCTAGGSDGRAIIHGSLGTKPYQYQIINTSNTVLVNNGTDSVFTGLTKGTYRFRLIDSCGNGVVQDIAIDTLYKPTIIANGTTYCTGTNAYFTANHIFEGATFAWSGPSGFSSANDTIFFNPIAPSDFGEYTLTQTVPACVNTKSTRFTLTNCMVSLPLHLLSFDAVKTGVTQASLSWEYVSTEEENKVFLLHSINGTDWNTIYQETYNKGKATSRFVHNAVFAGTNLYRLKMQDKVGQHTYSPVRSLNFDKAGDFHFQLLPNPASQNLSLLFSGAREEGVQADFVDPAGKVVLSLFVKDASHKADVDVSQLAKGFYVVRVQHQGRIYYSSLIIQ